jgi:hypothetical protein
MLEQIPIQSRAQLVALLTRSDLAPNVHTTPHLPLDHVHVPGPVLRSAPIHPGGGTILSARDPQGAESSSFDPLRVQGHWDPQGAGSSGCGILRVRGWSVQRLHRSEAWTACARFWGAPENTRADMCMVYNLHRCVLFHMI